MGKLCVIFTLSFLLVHSTARNIPDNALAPTANTQNVAISAASPDGNGVGDRKNFITFGGVGGWGGFVGFIPVLGGIGGVGTVPGGLGGVGGVGGVGGATGGIGGGTGGVGGGILP